MPTYKQSSIIQRKLPSSRQPVPQECRTSLCSTFSGANSTPIAQISIMVAHLFQCLNSFYVDSVPLSRRHARGSGARVEVEQGEDDRRCFANGEPPGQHFASAIWGCSCERCGRGWQELDKVHTYTHGHTHIHAHQTASVCVYTSRHRICLFFLSRHAHTPYIGGVHTKKKKHALFVSWAVCMRISCFSISMWRAGIQARHSSRVHMDDPGLFHGTVRVASMQSSNRCFVIKKKIITTVCFHDAYALKKYMNRGLIIFFVKKSHTQTYAFAFVTCHGPCEFFSPHVCMYEAVYLFPRYVS
jgi:hypothetical protein